MRAVVTGAGGFIGGHLTEALLRFGFSVRALVRYNSRDDWGHLEYLKGGRAAGLEVLAADVTDLRSVEALLGHCDIVFHLAALIGIPYSYHAPGSYLNTNLMGTYNVLEACRRASPKRVIITSTSEVYGTARYTPIDEDHPLQAQSPYAASKIAADKLAESYFRSFGLPVVTLRPFNTFGPRQSARAVIPTVLTQALAGKSEILLGNLDPKRDWVFVDDTVRAFMLAAEAPKIEGETIHFGTGAAFSVADMARRCLDVVGSTATIYSNGERKRPEDSEVDVLLCNPEKASRMLGWTPHISLDEGIAKTAQYIKDNLAHYRAGAYVV